MSTYSIYEVANFFRNKASMPPEKLQILCYYAEAWSHALLNKGMVNDTTFEAWEQGPVSPELDRDFRWAFIPKRDSEGMVDEEDKALLESVWVTYGDLSANELAVITRQEDPWKIARMGLDKHSNNVIHSKDMADFYGNIYIGD